MANHPALQVRGASKQFAVAQVRNNDAVVNAAPLGRRRAANIRRDGE